MTDLVTRPAVDDPGLDDIAALLVATRLRNVFRVNAVVSGSTGLACALAAPGIADVLEVERAPVGLTGLGLVGFAIALGLLSGARHGQLVALGRVIGGADLAWVVASMVLVTAGVFGAVGAVVVVAVGAIVGAFALLEIRGAAAIAASHAVPDVEPPFEAISVAAAVDAPADRAWPVVTDHELYGRLAPNLGQVEVTAGDGPGLARRCYDAKGRAWTETCTLWEDGRRFAVAVDTSDYPYPLAVMRGSWAVEPIAADRSRFVMSFLFQPRAGVRGRAFVWVMHAVFPLVLRRILRGWRQAATV